MTNKTLNYVMSSVIPKRCFACGELLDSERRGYALCSECQNEWNEQKHTPCSVCGRQVMMCRCMSNDMRSGLISYSASCIEFDSEISKKLIYSFKRKRSYRLADFFAMQIAESIFLKNGIHFENCIIVYPRRSYEGRARFGFDHARLLAVRVGKITGIKVCHIFGNKGMSAQKELDLRSRLVNAFASFYIKNKEECVESVKGKDVILIDDVVTTGCTALCLASLLHNAGANSTSLFTIGKVPSKKTKNIR